MSECQYCSRPPTFVSGIAGVRALHKQTALHGCPISQLQSHQLPYWAVWPEDGQQEMPMMLHDAAECCASILALHARQLHVSLQSPCIPRYSIRQALPAWAHPA